MAPGIYVNIAWQHQTITRRHQTITWTNVDLPYVWSSDIYMRTVSQEIPQPLTTKISLKITHLKFTLNLPGAYELIHLPLGDMDIIFFYVSIQNSLWCILSWAFSSKLSPGSPFTNMD